MPTSEMGSIATGSSQQQVRLCPLWTESGSEFRAFAAAEKRLRGLMGPPWTCFKVSNYGDAAFNRLWKLRSWIFRRSALPRPCARTAEFLQPDQAVSTCPVPLRKNIPLPIPPNSSLSPSPSRPARGAYRDRHGRWVRDAVDAAASCARGIAGRIDEIRERRLKHADERCCRGRPNRVVLTPRRWCQVLWRHVGPTGRGHSIFARRRWQKSPVTGESATYAVKTIACGNAGRFRCTRRYSCASTTTKRARGCGCSGHPAFPTPSIFSGGER